MSHKVFSSGLMEFVGVEVVSLFPCTLHPGHIQFVLALLDSIYIPCTKYENKYNLGIAGCEIELTYHLNLPFSYTHKYFQI